MLRTTRGKTQKINLHYTYLNFFIFTIDKIIFSKNEKNTYLFFSLDIFRSVSASKILK